MKNKVSIIIVVVFLTTLLATVNAQIPSVVRYNVQYEGTLFGVKPPMVNVDTQPAFSVKPVMHKKNRHKNCSDVKRKFFTNGITGVNDLIWRFENRKDLVGDYNGALGYDSLLIQHLSMLNQRYGWGFKKVDYDTALWILRNSEEVYEPFGYGEYTIFGLKNGSMVPMTRGSYGAEKLIKFHDVAFTSCYCGNLMMPAQPVQSWPARIKPAPDDCKCNQSCGWWNGFWGPWWLFPILLMLALIAFIIWLLRDRHMTHGHNHNHQHTHQHTHRWPPRPPADTSNHTMD